MALCISSLQGCSALKPVAHVLALMSWLLHCIYKNHIFGRSNIILIDFHHLNLTRGKKSFFLFHGIPCLINPFPAVYLNVV